MPATSESDFAILIPGLKAFLDALPGHIDALVVTGGDQNEVRTVFAARDLDRYFRIVLGSPTSKHDNMQVLARRGVFGARSLYFGDAELAIRLAMKFGLDFLKTHINYILFHRRFPFTHKCLVDNNTLRYPSLKVVLGLV